MMRLSVLLVLIILLSICGPSSAALTFTFGRDQVIQLSKTIVSQSQQTHELPSSYMLPDDVAIINAPTAFEILVRTLNLYRVNQSIPEKVSGVTMEFTGPDEEKDTPIARAVLTQEVIDWATATMEFTKASNNKIAQSNTFPSRCQLTAAQYTVAMAMVITAKAETGTVPDTLLVPAVRAPKSWADQRNPLPVIPPPPPIEPVTLRVIVNGLEVPNNKAAVLPTGLMQPFCGPIRISIYGRGNVKKISLLFDGNELSTFDGAGVFGYALDSLAYADDAHLLSVQAYGDKGAENLSMGFTLQINNGRMSQFTPAEIEKPVDSLDATQRM